MAVVPWNKEQKRAFLQSQFEAQNQYYRSRYPNASFNLIKFNNEPVGRFYLAELADEFRIIDLTFLPPHFNRDIFIGLVKDVLQKGETNGKPVRIYLESFSPLIEIFTELDFQKVDEHGIYFLWQWKPVALKTDNRVSAINA